MAARRLMVNHLGIIFIITIFLFFQIRAFRLDLKKLNKQQIYIILFSPHRVNKSIKSLLPSARIVYYFTDAHYFVTVTTIRPKKMYWTAKSFYISILRTSNYSDVIRNSSGGRWMGWGLCALFSYFEYYRKPCLCFLH